MEETNDWPVIDYSFLNENKVYNNWESTVVTNKSDLPTKEGEIYTIKWGKRKKDFKIKVLRRWETAEACKGKIFLTDYSNS